MNNSLNNDKPAWQRNLIWLCIGVVLLIILGVGVSFRLLLVAAAVALPLWKWHGMNVLRTWSNPATASFTRSADASTGGYLFDVQPARAARMPAQPLFVIGVILLLNAVLVGSRSTGAFIGLYIVALVFIGVGCTYVLPGASNRKSAKISVSKQGIQSGEINIPLKAVADLNVTHNGLVVDPDPLMPGPDGVPIASIAGRHMGRRQSARGFTVVIRADGQSQASSLAGGLTEECALALVADIKKAMDDVA